MPSHHWGNYDRREREFLAGLTSDKFGTFCKIKISQLATCYLVN